MAAPDQPLTELRWARGTVAAVAATTVTLKMLDRDLIVTRGSFKPLPSLITAGERLLVKYDGTMVTSSAGDSSVYSTSDNALEVRQMAGTPD